MADGENIEGQEVITKNYEETRSDRQYLKGQMAKWRAFMRETRDKQAATVSTGSAPSEDAA